jgi:hypothetical protein
VLRLGSKKPGPAKDGAAAISAFRSSFVSATAWPKKANLGRIAGDPAIALDYGSRSLVHRVAQIPAGLMAVHCAAQKVARRGIATSSRPHDEAGNIDPDWGSLQIGKVLAHRKAEFRIEAKRAKVITRLHQPQSGSFVTRSTIDHVLH